MEPGNVTCRLELRLAMKRTRLAVNVYGVIDNQAIAGPETLDAIRALAGTEPSGAASTARTDAVLGVLEDFHEPFRSAAGRRPGPYVHGRG
jgi:hypothetical protein